MFVTTPHTGEVSAISLSHDGELLASVCTDRYVKVWDAARLTTAPPRWEKIGHDWEINHTQFSRDGRELFTCATNGSVRAWDARTGDLLRETKPDDPLGRVGSANAFMLSLDGKQIAWGGNSMMGSADIAVGDTADLVAKRRLVGHTRAIAIIVTHEGGWISGGVDQTVRFWDHDAKTPTRSIRLSETIRGLAVTRDGGRLAASAGPGITLWELPRPGDGRDTVPPRRERHLRGHTKQIDCIELSPDETLLASTGLDGTIRVWDVATGAAVRVLDPGLGPLHWVTFAPDGLTLGFSSHKGHIGLIDVDV